MEHLLKRALPNWPDQPLPGLYLSSSGLIALADLKTIPQRTAIVGGASWLDALLLAPGLHYQQAADAVDDHLSEYSALEIQPGKTSLYRITNPATIRFLRTVGKDGDPIIVDVGMSPQRQSFYRRRRRGTGQRSTIWNDQSIDLGLLSHLLYLASPLLTVCALVFMILTQEWWGIGLLLALMLARLLNVWVIKQRAKPRGPPIKRLSPEENFSSSTCDSDGPENIANLLTEYIVDLGQGRSVCLRGLAEDLKAITATQWLASKTQVENYLQATGTMIVYIVAALSGNMTQMGQFIFAALLVANAALLGLSNGHARTLRMHGRIAAPTAERLARLGGGGGGDVSGTASWVSGRKDLSEGLSDRSAGSASKPGSGYLDSMASVSWPPSARTASTRETSFASTVFDDYAEKGQIGKSVRFPFE